MIDAPTRLTSLQWVVASCVVCRLIHRMTQWNADLTVQSCRHVGTPLAVSWPRNNEPNAADLKQDRERDEAAIAASWTQASWAAEKRPIAEILPVVA